MAKDNYKQQVLKQWREPKGKAKKPNKPKWLEWLLTPLQPIARWVLFDDD